MYHFYHNKNIITFDSYTYVKLYKKQLLENITTLLEDLNIKFVISHGNLIEYVRGKYIFQDDDLDIRFDTNDFEKWKNYCKNNSHNNIKYNLNFNHNFYSAEKQLVYGTQANLIKFVNKNKIQEYPKMDIHLDLVANNVNYGPWCKYNINFNNLRKIRYLDIETFAPSLIDTNKVLIKEYGPLYIIPNKKIRIEK